MEKWRHTEFTAELAQPPVDAVTTLQCCLTKEVHLTYHRRRRLLGNTWDSCFLKVGMERQFSLPSLERLKGSYVEMSTVWSLGVLNVSIVHSS